MIDCNPALLELFGYTKEEMIGLNVSETYLNPKDRDGMRKKISGNDFVKNFEVKLRRKDTTEMDCSINAVARRDKNGNIIGYQGIIRDITERKQAEEELKLFRTLIDHSNDAIEVIDPETGHFLDVNEKSCLDLGYSREEFLSLGVFDIDPNLEQSFFPMMMEDIRKSGVMLWNGIHRRKNGTTFPVEVTLSYVHLDRDYLVAIARDITERKRLEKQKLLMEAQLRQSQKLESIGILAGGVAHEINNPIQGIMGYADLINRRVEDRELKQFAGGILKETDRVAKIVRNLLSFARQDKLNYSPSRLEDIIDASLNLIGAMLRKDQITIEQDIPDDLPKVTCRSQQIEQVVMNLLTNARDALNQRYAGYHEDKIIRISVRPFGKEGETWVRTTVEDHGIGIPENMINQIFDPFFTTKSKAKGRAAEAAGPTGTGLGLSISYGIISDHHGTLWVESEEGEYTRFHMDMRVDNEWTLEESEMNHDDREEMKVTDDVGEKKGEYMMIPDEGGG